MSRSLKWLLAAAMVLLFACNKKQAALTDTNAKGEVPVLGNLVFRFDKALVPDSLLNRWDSLDYIRFEPAIPGRFRWEHPDELIFSPAAPLAPATTYRATLTKSLLAHNELDKVRNEEALSFHTPALRLENTQVRWVLADGKATPQLDLYFNYPVTPAALKEKLTLDIDGRSRSLQALSLQADKLVSFRITDLATEDRDYSGKLVVAKGLLPEGGTDPLPEPLEEAFSIPSPYNLVINGIESSHDGLGASIKVFTSQQVLAEGLKNFLQVNPSANFSAEAEEDGFRVSGEGFSVDKTYALLVRKGLRGVLGGTLREDYQGDIVFGELEPTIRFGQSKAIYLSAQGNRNIDVRITNIPRIKVVVSKIYESNLLAAQTYGYYPRSSGDEAEGYEEMESDGAVLGDIIYEQEIDTRTLPRFGEGRLFHFSMADRLPDLKGIYHLSIRSAEEYWVSDGRFIALSDIGLIAKEGADKMVVFAHSIKSAASLSGVNITVYGANNQVLGMGVTDGNGAAEIAFSRREFSGFRPAMVIAKSGSDFNYLPFQGTRVNTSRFNVGGKAYNSTGMDAFIYAERDIYRPGEKINANVVVRNRDWSVPGELPIKLKLLLPNGREFRQLRKMLDAEGSAEVNIDIPASAITGAYQLELYSGNDVLMGNKTFSIEEFVPDRIRVEAAASRNQLRAGDSMTLAISATNFFGPPAANRNYACELQFKAVAFAPARYERFNFALSGQSSFFDKVLREGKTDPEGKAREQFIVPAMFLDRGLLKASVYTTVFDETARPVSRVTNMDVYTQDVFFGIGTSEYSYFPLNQAVRIPIVAVDREGKSRSVPARVRVIKHEYRTVLSKSGGYFRYESQKEEKVVREETVSISGDQASFSFIPRQPGEYEIRVSAPRAESWVSARFYSYGAWGGDASSFEVDSEGQIDIELDKKSYLAGEKAKVLFKTPFSGRMLVTMETDRLISYQYVDVPLRSATLELPLSASHLPNVYVTATLFKPHTISDIPLTVAYGFTSIRVEEQSRKMDLRILAALSSRSRTRQRVKVQAAPNSYVTLAAVDNGVLQVSDMKTPDPYGWFYASRRLGMTTFNVYPLLFPELRPRASSTGGDMDEMAKRVNPMPNKRVKIMSYWSGIRKTNGSGEAEFDVEIPQFSGEIRLMAVGYRDKQFGTAERQMTVADPMVISTGLPRFLSPGDTITIPVTLSNTTTKSTQASTTLSVKGPLQVAGDVKRTVHLPPQAETVVTYSVYAKSVIGAGQVRVDVQALGEKFADETEITVRPPSTLQQASGSGSVGAGTSQALPISLDRFMPGSSRYQLVLSQSPVLDFGDQLRYLVQYPYGCTEQTVSAAFPQLYFGDLADAMRTGLRGSQVASLNVQEAIRRIKMRQLYNGALTLWEGGGQADWWTTTYAAHFLLEARKAGYDFDRSLLETMLGYLNSRLRTRESVDYLYNRDQRKKIAPKEVAYSLYVLALANKPNIAVMNYYKSNSQVLALDSRYLLATAYAHAGDRKAFAATLPSSFAGESAVGQTGGSFYSDVRDEAIALNMLIETDPANAQIPILARHVSAYLRERTWLSTQERVFALLALGKLTRNAARNEVTAQVMVKGKTVAQFTGKDMMLTSTQLDGGAPQISVKGKGRLYYYWQAEGISTNGTYQEEDRFLKVRRQWLNRQGQPISGSRVRQNDLIVVRITLERTVGTSVDNVVITDLLPAGFEIENPRTREIPGMDWIRDAATPSALDVRDDRMHLFVDARSGKQVYYYAVRAVSPGTFRVGPVSADAMYRGEYHSYHGAGSITVVR